jgi:4-carboxymuconolactone decarboxylase
MADETDYDAAGAAIQSQLWGERVGGSTAPAMPGAKLAPDYFALVRKFCFGMFWSRPNLALRDRSLITVAMLAALGRQEELAGHLRGALNVGVTKEELIEVLMQAGVYAGVPMGVAALNTAGPVLGTD